MSTLMNTLCYVVHADQSFGWLVGAANPHIEPFPLRAGVLYDVWWYDRQQPDEVDGAHLSVITFGDYYTRRVDLELDRFQGPAHEE